MSIQNPKTGKRPKTTADVITFRCGCVVTTWGPGMGGRKLCPLHNAAPDMLAALEAAQAIVENSEVAYLYSQLGEQSFHSKAVRNLRAAIAKTTQ